MDTVVRLIVFLGFKCTSLSNLPDSFQRNLSTDSVVGDNGNQRLKLCVVRENSMKKIKLPCPNPRSRTTRKANAVRILRELIGYPYHR